MKNKQLYCNICERETPHKYKGTQRGANNTTLDLYDCLSCRDTCGRWEDEQKFIGSIVYFDIPDNSNLAEQFRTNHSHLWRWLNSGLGREYLRRQNEQRAC